MNIVGLLGLPGAGKTTAMDGLTDRIDVDIQGIQMSAVAKRCYDKVDESGMDGFSEEFQEQLSDESVLKDDLHVTGNFSEEIGDWVDTVLSVDGEYFASRAINSLRSKEADLFIVDGIRSTADANILTQEADNCVFYFLHCPFETRLMRLQEREGGKTLKS